MKGQNNTLAGISSTDATLEAQGIVGPLELEAQGIVGPLELSSTQTRAETLIARSRIRVMAASCLVRISTSDAGPASVSLPARHVRVAVEDVAGVHVLLKENGGPPKEAAVSFGLPAESNGLIRVSH
jgi:hypothetical protein